MIDSKTPPRSRCNFVPSTSNSRSTTVTMTRRRVNIAASIWILLVCLLSCVVRQVSGNALLTPSHRGMVWSRQYHDSTNYNYMEIKCGGLGGLRRNDGECGLCGDPFDRRRLHEHGGKYATGTIARTYERGERTINAKILLNSDEGGYFIFHLCDANGTPETQACFDKHFLKVTEGRAQGDEWAYVVQRAGVVHLTLEIPEGLTCWQCVLQWTYVTSNTWGRDPDGTACVGCGVQPMYVNCADISIEGWGNATQAPPTVKTTTPPPPPPPPSTTRPPSPAPEPTKNEYTTRRRPSYVTEDEGSRHRNNGDGNGKTRENRKPVPPRSRPYAKPSSVPLVVEPSIPPPESSKSPAPLYTTSVMSKPLPLGPNKIPPPPPPPPGLAPSSQGQTSKPGTGGSDNNNGNGNGNGNSEDPGNRYQVDSGNGQHVDNGRVREVEANLVRGGSSKTVLKQATNVAPKPEVFNPAPSPASIFNEMKPQPQGSIGTGYNNANSKDVKTTSSNSSPQTGQVKPTNTVIEAKAGAVIAPRPSVSSYNQQVLASYNQPAQNPPINNNNPKTYNLLHEYDAVAAESTYAPPKKEVPYQRYGGAANKQRGSRYKTVRPSASQDIHRSRHNVAPFDMPDLTITKGPEGEAAMFENQPGSQFQAVRPAANPGRYDTFPVPDIYAPAKEPLPPPETYGIFLSPLNKRSYAVNSYSQSKQGPESQQDTATITTASSPVQVNHVQDRFKQNNHETHSQRMRKIGNSHRDQINLSPQFVKPVLTERFTNFMVGDNAPKPQSDPQSAAQNSQPQNQQTNKGASSFTSQQVSYKDVNTENRNNREPRYQQQFADVQPPSQYAPSGQASAQNNTLSAQTFVQNNAPYQRMQGGTTTLPMGKFTFRDKQQDNQAIYQRHQSEQYELANKQRNQQNERTHFQFTKPPLSSGILSVQNGNGQISNKQDSAGQMQNTRQYASQQGNQHSYPRNNQNDASKSNSFSQQGYANISINNGQPVLKNLRASEQQLYQITSSVKHNSAPINTDWGLAAEGGQFARNHIYNYQPDAVASRSKHQNSIAATVVENSVAKQSDIAEPSPIPSKQHNQAKEWNAKGYIFQPNNEQANQAFLLFINQLNKLQTSKTPTQQSKVLKAPSVAVTTAAHITTTPSTQQQTTKSYIMKLRERMLEKVRLANQRIADKPATNRDQANSHGQWSSMGDSRKTVIKDKQNNAQISTLRNKAEILRAFNKVYRPTTKYESILKDVVQQTTKYPTTKASAVVITRPTASLEITPVTKPVELQNQGRDSEKADPGLNVLVKSTVQSFVQSLTRKMEEQIRLSSATGKVKKMPLSKTAIFNVLRKMAIHALKQRNDRNGTSATEQPVSEKRSAKLLKHVPIKNTIPEQTVKSKSTQITKVTHLKNNRQEVHTQTGSQQPADMRYADTIVTRPSLERPTHVINQWANERPPHIQQRRPTHLGRLGTRLGVSEWDTRAGNHRPSREVHQTNNDRPTFYNDYGWGFAQPSFRF